MTCVCYPTGPPLVCPPVCRLLILEYLVALGNQNIHLACRLKVWPVKGGRFDYSEPMAELLNVAIYENYFVTFLECDNTAMY